MSNQLIIKKYVGAKQYIKSYKTVKGARIALTRLKNLHNECLSHSVSNDAYRWSFKAELIIGSITDSQIDYSNILKKYIIRK